MVVLGDDCDTMCTMDYNPVCGGGEHSTKTFSNECELGVYNCQHNTSEFKLIRTIFVLTHLLVCFKTLNVDIIVS